MIAQTRLRRSIAAVLVTIAAVGGLVACGDDTPRSAPSTTSGVPIAGDFSGSGPGSLRSAETLPTVDRRVTRLTSTAARITYQSTSGVDGSSVVVSGTVFSPIGPAPQGGWPVIAYGHGTTGVQHECAPSLSPSLLGAADAIGILVKDGYVVVMPDYQGLGLDDTYHPYLDAATVGHNMIDGVRAARQLVSGTSDRWIAIGSSQGGQAAWAANELSGNYGAGLDLLGSVSLAPVTDISDMATKAAAGTLTQQQQGIYPWILWAQAKMHPDLDLDDYRHGTAQRRWDVLTACQGDLAAQRASVVRQLTPDDLRPSSPAATTALRDDFARMRLPTQRAGAPMLVVYGAKDQLVDPQWTGDAIGDACRRGDTVESYLLPEAGHDDIDGTFAVAWIQARLRGTPPLNTCGRSVPPPTAQIPGASAPDQQ
ncbi:lipase family protein [Williamsia deligens]|uniref:Lipase family protein n=1 Tax=Williamsia deligens TaxID=321325 RepID=A0ABW3G9Z8_9NOCA|nr:lipase family protein [Williamsia deligens]MCP2195746.1 Secretory lipase [Williamsia deligens]